MSHLRALWFGAVLCATIVAGARAQEAIRMSEALIIADVGTGGRAPVHTDAVEHLLVQSRWSTPDAGDEIELPDGSVRTWESATGDEDGWIGVRGYALWEVRVPSERVMLLNARGHSHVTVNGAPRAGDPYRYGFVRLPVKLNAGHNELLFRVGRGAVRATLRPMDGAVMFGDDDRTLPDLVSGFEGDPLHAGLVAINGGDRPIDGGVLSVRHAGKETRTPAPIIPALSTRKIHVVLPAATDFVDGQAEYTIELQTDLGTASTSIRLKSVSPDELHRLTFVSGIDRSVQEYVVQPRTPGDGPNDADALILSLHGASVKARRQASSYSAKPWCTLVAPTNRRPFGFDWEDWGRLDAMEVLGLAEQRFAHDPQRVHVTGHSMGGHGTWHLGSTFPDRFASIAPSAGWVSFWSYTGAAKYEDASPIERLLRRAANASDTLELSQNLDHVGVYILHGDKDDNVPVTQARTMRTRLAEFHTDFAYYEQPGAGHWWGNRCMDWPPLMAFLEDHRNTPATEVTGVRFTTMSPAISDRCDWATVYNQQRSMEPSRVDLRVEEGSTIAGTTENVQTLVIDLDAMTFDAEEITVTLDESSLTAPSTGSLWLVRDGASWRGGDRPIAHMKGPHRAGPFKEAFRNGMVFVYGTGGTDVETTLHRDKARYDAETFWYRGNSSIDVIDDQTFKRRAGGEYRDRNVILYGNAKTNTAWDTVLGDPPIYITDRGVQLQGRTITGDDLACLFVFPRSGSETASVGVVAGTGPTGTRLAMRIPYFVSGIAYPDFTVLDPSMLTDGSAGVRAAGFFGNNWTLRDGEHVIVDR